MRDLLKGNLYKDKTLEKAIETWAPKTENDTEAYIKDVIKQTGLSRDTKISSLSDARLERLVKAMATHEGYNNPNLKITPLRSDVDPSAFYSTSNSISSFLSNTYNKIATFFNTMVNGISSFFQGRDDANFYTVQKGDTLAKIAKRYGLTVEQDNFMKKKVKSIKKLSGTVILLFVIMFFVGNSFAEVKSNGVNSYKQNKPYKSEQIKWLNFTSTGYAYERSLVKKDNKDDVKEAEKIAGEKVDVYISLEDLNDDGAKEIFAWIYSPAICSGAGPACGLLIYTISQGKLKEIGPPVSITLRIDSDGSQNIIGVMRIKKMGWKNIFINKKELRPIDIWMTNGRTNNIWKWNGSKYE